MQIDMGKKVLEKTKYALSIEEKSEMTISQMYDDCRMASEYEADGWVVDEEILFTVPEIMFLFE